MVYTVHVHNGIKLSSVRDLVDLDCELRGNSDNKHKNNSVPLFGMFQIPNLECFTFLSIPHLTKCLSLFKNVYVI